MVSLFSVCRCCLLWVLATTTALPSSSNQSKHNASMRLNRALRATRSRRQTNRIIADGRMQINGQVTTNPNARLHRGDVVLLDGTAVVWHESDILQPHRYLKFHKPAGVVVTTDPHVPQNIMTAMAGLNDDKTQRRVYPIGRLDAASTGLILLTSNGAMVNPLLRSGNKIYHVTTEPAATEQDIAALAAGVVITTPSRVQGRRALVTQRTHPCVVERRLRTNQSTTSTTGTLQFILTQGRNRQIRHMTASLGLRVTVLHRVAFGDISLEGIDTPGSWAVLTEAELVAMGVPRNERRTPEERAARKAKKETKRRKKQRMREG